jgi:tetratricopeptide (TPR) repeat protein
MLPTDKEDFFSLCQNVLQGNDQLLAILQEFKEGYSPDRAISWLYRDAFFIGYINCIFTVAHIDSIYVCRAFIHDIYKQLEQHKCTSTIQVYRCEQMSNENFQKLKQLNGKIIPMKSWFLTNSNREAILSYMSSYDSSNECKRILFIIEADPQIPNVKPFAKIGSLSNYNDPNDVLFMIGSLFKITEIEDEKDGIINIKMTLCANDDENALKASFDRLKYQYINSNGETDLIGFGQLLFAIGNSLRDKDISNRGEELIRSFLGKLPKDHADHVRCYDALGYIDLIKNEFDLSLDWYKKSFEIKKDKLPANDPNLAESYKNMAAAYLQKKDFTQALEYFKQLLIILKQLYGDDHIALIPCYADMASIYETEDKLTEAFSCYSQVEVILIKNHATNDMDFARLCNNLGKIRTFLGHYHLALGYYMTSLQIKSSLLTSVDPSIATTYKNIGLVYGYMDNLEQSRENLEKAAEIYRQVQSHDNPNVTEIEELIQNLTSPPK